MGLDLSKLAGLQDDLAKIPKLQELQKQLAKVTKEIEELEAELSPAFRALLAGKEVKENGTSERVRVTNEEKRKRILITLREGNPYKMAHLVKSSGLKASQITSTLHTPKKDGLVDEGLVSKDGDKRSTSYRLTGKGKKALHG